MNGHMRPPTACRTSAWSHEHEPPAIWLSIDIGANLTHSAFEHDFENVVTESLSAGLSHIILTGTDLHSSTAATNLARRRPGTQRLPGFIHLSGINSRLRPPADLADQSGSCRHWRNGSGL